MRIAIDLRALQIGHQYRGIGAYITNVVGRFPADSDHTFIIIRYGVSNPVDDFNLPFTDYEEIVMKKPGEPHGLDLLKEIIKRRFSRKFGNLSAHRPDVFFQPDFQLGLPRGWRMKKYVVMYDVIPLILKEMYLPSWKRLFSRPGLGKMRRLRIIFSAWLKEAHYARSLRALHRADGIFSISEATAADLHAHVGVPKSKIKTIPLAPSVSDIQTTAKDRPKQLAGTKSPFLFYMGGIDERRRVADLVHAFNLLNGHGHAFDLVLGGKELANAEEIPNIDVRDAVTNSSYRDRIYLLGFTSQEEKAWLMEHAFAFVYPTFYEGFGLPVLESMLQGCPTITYDNSSLPEIAGDAAILLKEDGGTAIRDAILKLVNDPKQREALIKAGKKQAAKFSWERCAEETYQLLTKRG